ncbi:MAG: sensor histidine kinase [Bacteroidota bacterium]
MRTKLLFFILLCAYQLSFAQKETYEKSLKLIYEKLSNMELPTAQQLFQKLELKEGNRLKNPLYHYLKGRFAYEKGNYDLTINEFLIARDLYLALNNLAMIAQINSNITSSYNETGQFKEAKKSIEASIDYYKKIGNIPQYYKDLGELGRVLINSGDYLKAAEIYIKTLTYYDSKGTIKEKGRVYAQIGLAYDYAGILDKAEKYYLQAIDFRKEVKDTIGLMNTYNNLGIVNKNQALYSKAFSYYNQSYALAKASKRDIYKINPLINMGVSSRHLGKYDEAIGFYIEALDLAKKNNRQSQVITINNNLAYLYYYQKKYDIALPLAKSAIAYAEEKGTLEDKVNYLQIYAAILKEIGKNDEAYSSLLKSYTYSDSLYKGENAKAMAEMSTKYETEKKEQQIKLLRTKTSLQQLNISNQHLELEKRSLEISNKTFEINNKNLLIVQKESDVKQKSLLNTQQKQKIQTLNQQNEIQVLEIRQKNIYLIIALFLFLFLASTGYFIYNRRKLKAKAQLQEEINKQQDLAARAVLDAEEHERRRIAGDLHDGVGQMLSAALMNLNGLFKKLELTEETNLQAGQVLTLVNEAYDEMRIISHQMMPNALIKSGLALAVKEFLNKIDKDVIKVTLEMVGLKERLNEQTETILYRVIQETVNNVIKHSRANRLDIIIIKDEEGVTATVEDNGKGFDKTKIDLKSGIGISNIYSRVEFLKGTVDIDTTPDKGTLVAIHIPD